LIGAHSVSQYALGRSCLDRCSALRAGTERTGACVESLIEVAMLTQLSTENRSPSTTDPQHPCRRQHAARRARSSLRSDQRNERPAQRATGTVVSSHGVDGNVLDPLRAPPKALDIRVDIPPRDPLWIGTSVLGRVLGNVRRSSDYSIVLGGRWKLRSAWVRTTLGPVAWNLSTISRWRTYRLAADKSQTLALSRRVRAPCWALQQGLAGRSLS
jgi:hypothetical protein